GIELQTELAERAVKNVVLNSLQERVSIVHDDIRNVRNFVKPATMDMVVSNPPYRHPDSGRIAPNDERAAARHELAGGLPEFIAAAKWLLKNGGGFAVIYLAERLPKLLTTLVAAGIEPKRLRMVHPRYGAEAKLVLLEGRKGGRPGLQVEPPLFIYKTGGSGREYSEEVLRMYDA
ncbi:MAG: SAM-dependent methyltransferase, partial [Desulfuromonadales bacterium]|nr:SAM-dependent methyltransferase [Desulfuromonadales bacterium]